MGVYLSAWVRGFNGTLQCYTGPWLKVYLWKYGIMSAHSGKTRQSDNVYWECSARNFNQTLRYSNTKWWGNEAAQAAVKMDKGRVVAGTILILKTIYTISHAYIQFLMPLFYIQMIRPDFKSGPSFPVSCFSCSKIARNACKCNQDYWDKIDFARCIKS